MIWRLPRRACMSYIAKKRVTPRLQVRWIGLGEVVVRAEDTWL
jgi:hypothetical protein